MVDRDEAIALLDRAPRVLEALYSDLPQPWLHASDAGEWSAHSVLVHMVAVEDHAWVHRIEHALDHPAADLPAVNPGGPDAAKPVDAMLREFAELRRSNIDRLRSLDLRDETAMHRALGPVTVDEILATWAIHDLNHMAQAMASISSRYRDAVGPFIPNLGILGEAG